MTTIPFTRSPVAVTLGEAMGLAGRYWSASWERWVLAVVAVGLASGLAQFFLGSSLLDQQAVADSMVPGAIDPSEVPRLLAGPIAVAIVSLVADWFLYANAILGLRGGEMPLRRVLGAGLRVLLVVLLLVPGVMLAAIGLTATGVLGLLAIVALFPIGIVPAAAARVLDLRHLRRPADRGRRPAELGDLARRRCCGSWAGSWP